LLLLVAKFALGADVTGRWVGHYVMNRNEFSSAHIWNKKELKDIEAGLKHLSFKMELFKNGKVVQAMFSSGRKNDQVEGVWVFKGKNLICEFASRDGKPNVGRYQQSYKLSRDGKKLVMFEPKETAYQLKFVRN